MVSSERFGAGRAIRERVLSSTHGALLVPLVSLALSAQSATLRGRALTDSTDRPIVGAVVAIDELKRHTISDSLGHFVLTGIAPGEYIVRAQRIGFGALATRVRFTANLAVEADFLMTRNVQDLPDVNVNAKRALPPKLAEFEERRTAGVGGRFITQDEIDKRAYSVTADIIRTKVPGMEIMRDVVRPSQAYVVGGRMQVPGGAMANGGAKPGPCFAAVVLDGIFVYQGNYGSPTATGSISRDEPPFDTNSIGPSVIAGIEYYASAASIPTKYNGMRNTCGLMLICWTR